VLDAQVAERQQAPADLKTAWEDGWQVGACEVLHLLSEEIEAWRRSDLRTTAGNQRREEL